MKKNYYLEKLYSSDKPFIVYKVQGGYDLFTDFSEKIYILKAELKNLKTGFHLIEEKAREELGLIKDKETFYQIIN